MVVVNASMCCRAMQKLSGLSYNSSEQNKEVTQARLERDWKDTTTLLNCLQERNPFSNSDSTLRNIYTGLHAQDTVNADEAQVIGNGILNRMEGETVAEYIFKKNHQVTTLDTKSVVKIEGITVQIDPQLLFQRLTLAAKAAGSIEDVFKYELCSYPPALYDSSLMLRQSQKSVLANAMWNTLSLDTPKIPGDVRFVLDGGSLLQRIPWTQGATYGDTCTVYLDCVTKKYGEAIVVFDGYRKSSTKDMVHLRRVKGFPGVAVSFTKDTKLNIKKDIFLTNSLNKQHFIDMLGCVLERNCKVYHSSGDADLMIVQKAVEVAREVDTVLVGDDTDLLVLLCYYASLESHNIFFKPEPKKATKNPRVWNITAVKKKLGPELCSNILFLHAILGCDTTSQLFGIGKGTSLKRFKSSKHFQAQANVFNVANSTPNDIMVAGERALVELYNGNSKECLNSLRYRRFCEKVATSTTTVLPQTLPPSSAAAKYHSFHVYLQIQEWKGNGSEMQPTEWGWKEYNGTLKPVLTDLPPAPDELLKLIRCNCHTDCSSMRCTCKKYNVKCSSACGNCKGTGCTNSDALMYEEEDQDIDNE